MEWMKTDVKIPDAILSLYQHIRKKAKNVCIAGGMLSDLYMKKDFKDVDIFLNSNPFELEDHLLSFGVIPLEKPSDGNFANTYDIEFTFDVRNYTYEGYDIQLIYTKHGAKVPKFFDFRFREFVFVRGHVFASAEAIADIEAKKLVFGSFHSPIRSLARMFRFMNKYDFTYDESSFSLFSSVFNSFWIEEDRINTYLSRLSPSAPEYEPLKKLLLKDVTADELDVNDDFAHVPLTKSKRVSLPTPIENDTSLSMRWLVYHLRTSECQRDFIELTCDRMKDGFEIVYSHVFDRHHFDTAAEVDCQNIRHHFRLKRTALLFSCEIETIEQIIKWCDDLLEPSKRHVALQELVSLELEIAELIDPTVFHSLFSLAYASCYFGKPIDVEVSNLPNFIRLPKTMRVYAHKHPISVLFHTPLISDVFEDDFLAGFVYDPSQDTFLKHNVAQKSFEFLSSFAPLFERVARSFVSQSIHGINKKKSEGLGPKWKEEIYSI